MNWKHLLYIIPLCLILGGWIGLSAFGNLIDFTMGELAAKAGEKLYDAQLAWKEIPLSNDRIMYGGEFCYKINNSIVCPKRNISILFTGEY